MDKGSLFRCVFLSLLLFLSLSFLPLSQGRKWIRNLTRDPLLWKRYSAVYVFGDSTVDAGNNDYIPTIFKSNFPPYGRDYFKHVPTGRFSNGRLTTDFLASHVGLKNAIPPYLDPTLSVEELMTGVSFASATSGYDPLTPKVYGVIDMPKQLEYFKEYKKKLEAAIGKERTADHIRKSVVIISAGTNDFVITYYGLPFRRHEYNVEEYQQFLLQKLQDFVEGVWELGPRTIAVSDLAPMGCLPLVITGSQRGLSSHRGCVYGLNSVARDYNRKLEIQLAAMQMRYQAQGARIIMSTNNWLLEEMTVHPSKFGFEETKVGCCGTGLLESSILCSPKTPACPDASKYVFFDSIHPTEKAYYILFKNLRYQLSLSFK